MQLNNQKKLIIRMKFELSARASEVYCERASVFVKIYLPIKEIICQ